LLSGLIVGAVARLVVPGRERGGWGIAGRRRTLV
jgi:hypothetical protein